MTTHHQTAMASKPPRGQLRLRRELLLALVLKLVLLFLLKAAFFPQRLSAAEAAQGVADRIASQIAPGHVTVFKDSNP